MATASQVGAQALRLSEQEIVQRDWTRIRFGLAIGIMAAGLGAATTILNLYTEFEGIGALERLPPGTGRPVRDCRRVRRTPRGRSGLVLAIRGAPDLQLSRTARAKAVGVAPTGRRVRVLLLFRDGGDFPPDCAVLLPLPVEHHVRPQRGGQILRPVHRFMARVRRQERVLPAGGDPTLARNRRSCVWAMRMGDR